MSLKPSVRTFSAVELSALHSRLPVREALKPATEEPRGTMIRWVVRK
ncbi:hypothetical protein [Streptomyces sp. NEAU-H3]